MLKNGLEWKSQTIYTKLYSFDSIYNIYLYFIALIVYKQILKGTKKFYDGVMMAELVTVACVHHVMSAHAIKDLIL